MSEEQDRQITLDISYPNDPEYEYITRLVRLELDKERENDILNNNGFIVAPTQGVKKDIKNQFSIFSSKFGQTMKDINPYGNRYRCECGHRQQKVYDRTICPVCGKPVIHVDDNYEYYGWLVLQDYWIINPALYYAIKTFIGKDFDNIIKYDVTIDEDGHQVETEKPKGSPYNGIGLIEFRDKFDEIMDYYLAKNKKYEKYDNVIMDRHKVFTQSIPVFTALLRPYSADKYQFSHESTNSKYTIINKIVSDLNKSSDTSNISKSFKKLAPIRKQIHKLLWDLQMKLDKLYKEIIDIIKGKKGTIRNLFGGRCNFSAREVIVADPTLRADQVRISYSSLLEMLGPRIINILVKAYNMQYAEAEVRLFEARIKKDPVIIKIINSIIYNATPDHRGLPVLINRPPTLAYGSILQMMVVGISDTTDKFEYVMQLPLQILPLMNADFDGDVLTIFLIINQAVYTRTFQIFNPRNAFYISKNTGLFNNDMNHKKDTIINANTMVYMGRHVYSDEDMDNINRIKAKWSVA